GSTTVPAVSGVATFSNLAINRAGSGYTLRASAAGVTEVTPPFTITPGTVSAAQSTVAATSPIAAGSGTSTITVTARDASGNPVSGGTVILTVTPPAGTAVTQPAGTTNASGVATGTLAATAAGSKTVSATIDGVAVTQTATV